MELPGDLWQALFLRMPHLIPAAIKKSRPQPGTAFFYAMGIIRSW